MLNGNFLPAHSNNNDEINIAEYLNILWKRKWWIIIIFACFVAGSIVFSLIVPEVYQTESLLRVGSYKKQSIENVSDTITVLYDKMTLLSLASQLGLNLDNIETLGSMFNVNTKSNFLSVIAKGNSPQATLDLINAITNFILNRHQKLFDVAKKKFDLEIEQIKREEEAVKLEIQELTSNIAKLYKDIKFYEEEIKKRVDSNSEAQGRIVETYIKLLANTKEQVNSTMHQIETRKMTLKNFDAKYFDKEFEKTYETKMTTIETAPILPQFRIYPARKKIVSSYSLIGLVTGIILAFVIEYFSKLRIKQKGQLKGSN